MVARLVIADAPGVKRDTDKERDMIRTGDIIENPVTGERMRFLEASDVTGGEYTLIELTLAPRGFVAMAHMHPYQTETFEVVSGTVTFKVAGETVTAEAGDVVTVEPGQAHKFWNVGETEAVFRTEVRPSLKFEQMVETMFALAADGKTNKKGMPNPIRLAVIAKAYFDDVRLPFPPVALQRLGLALGAPTGRLFGYEQTYAVVPASAPAGLAIAEA
ncbi:MAG: cupin domain-containing protein [Actinobacteria bacterium]|nr:cupin domain-containing protein [Actinomycetota bacterium]